MEIVPSLIAAIETVMSPGSNPQDRQSAQKVGHVSDVYYR
jgi:hypothetical protein